MAKISARNPAFSKYRAGDPASFDLLIETLNGFPIGNREDSLLIWKAMPTLPRLFLVTDTRFLPSSKPHEIYNAPARLAKTALENCARRNFKYGEKGMMRTTVLVAALIGTMDQYFKAVPRGNRARAFRAYRDLVLRSFELRMLLARNDARVEPEKHREVTKSLLNIVKNPATAALLKSEGGIGHMILAVKYYCGNRSNVADAKAFRKIIGLLKSSKSMEEFLRLFVQPRGYPSRSGTA